MLVVMMLMMIIVVGLIIDMAMNDDNTNTIIITMMIAGAGISISPPACPGLGLQSRLPLDVRASAEGRSIIRKADADSRRWQGGRVELWRGCHARHTELGLGSLRRLSLP
jgi:hypothetical protein